MSSNRKTINANTNGNEDSTMKNGKYNSRAIAAHLNACLNGEPVTIKTAAGPAEVNPYCVTPRTVAPSFSTFDELGRLSQYDFLKEISGSRRGWSFKTYEKAQDHVKGKTFKDRKDADGNQVYNTREYVLWEGSPNWEQTLETLRSFEPILDEGPLVRVIGHLRATSTPGVYGTGPEILEKLLGLSECDSAEDMVARLLDVYENGDEDCRMVHRTHRDVHVVMDLAEHLKTLLPRNTRVTAEAADQKEHAVAEAAEVAGDEDDDTSARLLRAVRERKARRG